ncbi:platelet-derived growth factor D isoform X2 [Scleropages formosus]|uniref:platelet-derived growth factor D isoform X2 n=1 Tax=Scleropages formosus TaxID=113540 RepID=UPI0010FAA8DE|nr:platelet-derived growth factor D isoform X2 [Scleropages formosus]
MRARALFATLSVLVSVREVLGAQDASLRALRASNSRRDDLYRKEETVAVSTGGHIQSPRYPGGYPRNVLLSWKLVSPLNTRIQLDFDSHFGLEEPENDVCRYDFVEVEDISESSTAIRGRWCGQKEVPPRITSKSHTVKVTFKSDDYFVVKPGFKLYYSLVDDSPPPPSETNWEAVTIPVSGPAGLSPPMTDAPLTAAALDETIAAFDTVEELLRHLNPETWQEDLESIYKETGHYRPRTFHHDRKHKSLSLLDHSPFGRGKKQETSQVMFSDPEWNEFKASGGPAAGPGAGSVNS